MEEIITRLEQKANELEAEIREETEAYDQGLISQEGFDRFLVRMWAKVELLEELLRGKEDSYVL